MTTIATLGPPGSPSHQAARQYKPEARILESARISEVFAALENGAADLAVIPVYNTREGEIKQYFRQLEAMAGPCWIDNIMLPVHLALGALDPEQELRVICGQNTALRQCEEYLTSRQPSATLTVVPDLAAAMAEIKREQRSDHGVIAPPNLLKAQGFAIRERELAPHNRTRFAVLGKNQPPPSGYDATAMITWPLKDRVGLLYDILGEFSRRGINLIDMRTKTDVQSQRLQFYFETEGHIGDRHMREARIESQIIQEPGAFKLLGSYPRLEMRAKNIHTIGFIGSGDMSTWFARRLENEGYQTIVTGRTTAVTPEEMIPQVEVVMICVPISATPAAIKKYGPLLNPSQALVLLAGEAENVLDTAHAHTDPGVELMLVHNLWGPQAESMKDKNASVVRTPRSGALCSEIESFLYQHGAVISQDTAARHDLLMGISQKLPSIVSMSLAMTIRQNSISPADLNSHATLTSLYGILAMARTHFQNPRTYAEIASTRGEGAGLVKNFADNLASVMKLAEEGGIDELCHLIEESRTYLTDDFLRAKMQQALEVDKTFGKKSY